MKSNTHRSSAERETLLRCDILGMTCVKNDLMWGRKAEQLAKEQEKLFSKDYL